MPSLTFYGKPARQGWKRKSINYIYINKKDGKVLSPHSLRHSLNSNLLRAGCNEAKIGSYMGWKPNKLTKTQQGYTEFRAEDLRDVVQMIDEIYLINPNVSANVAAF